MPDAFCPRSYSRQCLADFQRRGTLRAQRAVEFRENRILPSAVVEPGLFPTLLHEVRIEILAAVDARKSDRALRGFPRRVRYDRVRRAVFVLDFHLQKHFRSAVRSDEFRVAFVRDIEKTVAEHHAYGVFPLFQSVGHVERHVLRFFIEFRPGRVQKMISGLGAVEEQFELTEPANVGRRAAHRLVHRKFAPHLRQFVAADHRQVASQSVGHRQAVDVGFECDPPCSRPVGLR